MKKDEVSAYRKIMAGIRKDISKAKMKGKKVKSECCHRSKKDKYWIKKVKGSDTVLRCSECRTKLDFTELAALSDDPDKIRKYIKKTSKTYRNLLEIAKLLHNRKQDAKVLKYISNVIFGIYRLEEYLIALIADEFEPHRGKGKKKNKKGKKNSSGNRIVSGGKSLGNF